MGGRRRVSIAAVLFVFAGLSFSAAAVAGENPSGEAGATSDAAEKGASSAPEKARRKSVRMPFFTAAVDGGLIFFGDYNVSGTDANGETQTLHISSRAGIILKLQLNLLGSGIGIEISPLFSGEWTGDTGVAQLYAAGAQLGIAYRFHIRRFYPKIGIGAHLAYLNSGDIKRGVEAYGRLPIGFSIYFVRFLALELEVAWMSGVTGLRTEGLGIFDNIARYDYTNGLEAVIGLRFP